MIDELNNVIEQVESEIEGGCEYLNAYDLGVLARVRRALVDNRDQTTPGPMETAKSKSGCWVLRNHKLDGWSQWQWRDAPDGSAPGWYSTLECGIESDFESDDCFPLPDATGSGG